MESAREDTVAVPVGVELGLKQSPILNVNRSRIKNYQNPYLRLYHNGWYQVIQS